MPFADWMPQYKLCFAVASEHFGPARLHITPTGYEKDTNGNFAPSHCNRVYGLYVTARFEDDGRGFTCDISDFIQPELFQALEMVIAESTGQESTAQLEGDDGHLDITFHREADGSLRILCASPSAAWSVNCLRLQFECSVNPEALTETRKQVDELLRLVTKIDAGSIEA